MPGLPEPPLALFRRASALPGIRTAPLAPAILAAAVSRGGFGTEDPVDRMMVATALAVDAVLRTAARMPACAPLRALDDGRPGKAREG